MISQSDIQDFLNEDISLLYNDSGKELFVRGKLVFFSENALRLQTRNNTLIIPFSNVLKVKIHEG